MKKVMKYLMFVIALIMICPTAYADVKKRTEDNNYGVNKKWKITSDNLDNVLSTPYVDASLKIYDYADIITPDVEESLKVQIDSFISKTGFDMVILTDSREYYSTTENETYATDFYDYNDFGINNQKYDGVILYRNANPIDPYYNIYTFGDAQLYFPYEVCEKVLDEIYPELSNHIYNEGFSEFITAMQEEYNNGIPSDYGDYYVDQDGYLHQKYSVPFGIIFLISSIITPIIIGIMINKNKMVKVATRASEYLDSSSVQYTEKSDRFIHSHTSSYTVSDSSSSGGGGFSGGSRSGSSGGGHGGGGGRRG